MTRSSTIEALEVMTVTLHKEGDFDCDYQETDAVEDHSVEMALAGNLLTALRSHGLTVSKIRSDAGKPKRRGWKP